MTRDVVYSYIPVVVYSQREWDDGYRSSPIETLRQLVGRASSRGDVIKSDHIIPTKYHADKYTATSEYFSRYTGWYRGYHPVLKTWRNFRYHQYGYHHLPTYGEGRVTAGLVPEWVRASARTRARGRLAEADVNVGNLLGELPESLKMIASHAITVLQAYRAARRMEFTKIPRILGVRTVRDVPRSAAGAWFAYKFGWQPLVEDTYHLHSAVMKQLNRPVTGKVKAVQTTEEENPPWISTWQFKGTYTLGCEVGLSYKVEDMRLAQLNALGLVNPLSLAWELMPLSFVVDWFLPVGSFLQAMSAPLGLKFVSGYETDFIRGNGKLVPKDPGGYIEGDEPSVAISAFCMGRRVLSSWSTPSLYIRTDLNNNQLLTLLGLLAQRA